MSGTDIWNIWSNHWPEVRLVGISGGCMHGTLKKLVVFKGGLWVGVWISLRTVVRGI